MGKKIPDYIRFRAEMIRNLAYILAIPFGHLMLGFILGDFDNLKVKILYCLPFSILLCFLSYNLACYSIHILRREHGNI